jgi:hypothetical protein
MLLQGIFLCVSEVTGPVPGSVRVDGRELANLGFIRGRLGLRWRLKVGLLLLLDIIRDSFHSFEINFLLVQLT